MSQTLNDDFQNAKYLPYSELAQTMLANEWIPLAYVQAMSQEFQEHPDYYKSGKFRDESFEKFPRTVSKCKFNELYTALYFLYMYRAISKADIEKLNELMLKVESVIDGIPKSPWELIELPPPENATKG